MTIAWRSNARISRFTAVVAVFGLCAGLTGRDASAQSPAQSPAPSMLVSIDSRPRGATVRVDDPAGPALGTTPLHRVSLAPGWHNLYFSHSGYTTYELRAQVAVGSTTFRVALARATALRVTSNSGSSLVVIDGDEVGYTPAEIGGLRPGRHTIEVRHDGMVTFRRTIVLRGGATMVVDAVLEARAAQDGDIGTN